ncbi:MAG: hypothetical protein BGP01_04210 [Paludibacter sp. 47-17]|nr:MAG: hypothetical protein BGP01_04210 [Paludibacter sp. 47-17]
MKYQQNLPFCKQKSPKTPAYPLFNPKYNYQSVKKLTILFSANIEVFFRIQNISERKFSSK